MLQLTILRLLIAGFAATAAAAVLATIPTTNIHRRQADSSDPTCFNTCYGVDNSAITAAIDVVCQKWHGVIIGPVILGPFTEISDTVAYIPAPHTAEQGKIYLKINAMPGKGCTPQTIDYNTCIYNFWVPINECNEGSANGKQGGIWLDPCLEFKINPNPDGC